MIAYFTCFTPFAFKLTLYSKDYTIELYRNISHFFYSYMVHHCIDIPIIYSTSHLLMDLWIISNLCQFQIMLQ